MRNYATSSAGNVSSILGISSFQSRKAYFEIKTNKKQKRITPFQFQLFEYGNKNETVAASYFRQVFIEKYKPSGYLMGPEKPVSFPYFLDFRFIGSPDRIIAYVDRDTLETKRLGLEIKCPMKREIPTSPQDLLMEYIPQCLAYATILDFDSWDLFFFRDSYDTLPIYSWFRIQNNRDFWNKEIWPQVSKFMDAVESKDEEIHKKFAKGVTATEKAHWEKQIRKHIKIDLIQTNILQDSNSLSP